MSFSDNQDAFAEFCKRSYSRLESGEISVSRPITKLDMAVQYAIGRMYDRVIRTVTTMQIAEEITKFAPYLLLNEVDDIFWPRDVE